MTDDQLAGRPRETGSPMWRDSTGARPRATGYGAIVRGDYLATICGPAIASLPARLRELIGRGLLPTPDERPSAAELAAALAALAPASGLSGLLEDVAMADTHAAARQHAHPWAPRGAVHRMYAPRMYGALRASCQPRALRCARAENARLRGERR